MTDMVNHPKHYGGDTPYEAIKVIEAWELSYSLGNAVKYISRCGKKPGADPVEDLRKAAWYVNHEIERLQARPKVRELLGPTQPIAVSALDLPASSMSERLVPRMETRVESGSITIERQRYVDGTPKTDTNRHAGYTCGAPKFQISTSEFELLNLVARTVYVQRAHGVWRLANCVGVKTYQAVPEYMKERYVAVDDSDFYALRRDWLSEDDLLQLPKYEATLSRSEVLKSPSWLGKLYEPQSDAADGQHVVKQKYREVLRV